MRFTIAARAAGRHAPARAAEPRFDSSPGTGDVALSMAQSVPMAGAIVVTTPQGVAVADVDVGCSRDHGSAAGIEVVVRWVHGGRNHYAELL